MISVGNRDANKGLGLGLGFGGGGREMEETELEEGEACSYNNNDNNNDDCDASIDPDIALSYIVRYFSFFLLFQILSVAILLMNFWFRKC